MPTIDLDATVYTQPHKLFPAFSLNPDPAPDPDLKKNPINKKIFFTKFVCIKAGAVIFTP